MRDAASATLIAIGRLRERLTASEAAVRAVNGADGFLAALADVERALTSFAVTIGLERRAATMRQRAHQTPETRHDHAY